MKPLPLTVRLAAGLAVTAVEQARKLPGQLAGLPVTVVSEALQLSMRLQQRVTELAIKGDDALSVLRPVEQEPEWATFDEDEGGAAPAVGADLDADDPWSVEEQALAAEPPAVLPNYDELSLAQLRARLRTLSAEDLEELLAHERTHAARPEFTGMLTRRIANLENQ
ncbi:lipid droplet-associated protein [Saccharothrix sp. 6-C]|uniref:lipid droplet-associated protein n=1 Tax=Saccharothrix sp. 6-C TaxID=2781735 RepID=UPI0019172613|nr:lipid droplet-associated protein [Saccharothrix sp. 6-C]QQQ77173.1 lipid droplet-associated protein [Saccharothrix sp. 6-C]